MNELAVRQDSTLAISIETEELIKAGVAENTLKAYRRALKELEAWLSVEENGFRIDQNGNDNHGLNDAVLADYITQLHRQGKSPATISQTVAAIKWSAKNRNQKEVVGAITERTLAGIRREGKERGRGQVDGLTWKEVDRVCSFAEASRTLAGLRDSAMISLMSDCLLRISEVVAVNVCDIKGSTLYLKSSKTDQEGVGESLYICESTRRVIKRYLRKSDIKRGALFRRVRYQNHLGTGRLSVHGARDAIKRWAAQAEIEGFISGHSLRVGSAVSLAQAGASVVDMQTAGRWKSPSMPAHYAKAELAERGAIARFKDGK